MKRPQSMNTTRNIYLTQTNKLPSYLILLFAFVYFQNPDKEIRTKVFAKKIFNGEDFGEMPLDAHWKCDWRLVPKTEEEELLKYVGTQPEKRYIKDTTRFPPLLEYMIMKRNQQSDVPLLKLHINQGDKSKAVLKSTD